MTSLFFDIFGRDNGATQAFQNVGTAADNAGTRLAALNTQWKAAAAAEQEATTAMEAAAQRETTARSTAEAATTRLRDAENQLQQTRTAVASSAENVAAAEQRVSTARRDAAAAEQELASAEQNTVAAAERLTTAHNNASNAARQHSSALKEVENSTRSLGTETDNLISKFRNANLGSTMFAAIGASIQPLLASIGQLSGALGLLPAAVTAVGTAFGTAVVGVQGMGTALKNAETASKTAADATKADATAQQATSAARQAATAAIGGNAAALDRAKAAQLTATQAVSAAKSAHDQAKQAADAYAQSLQGLAPAAQQVVSAIVQLKPAFEGLKLDVQQHLFQGIGQELQNLGSSVLPVVRTGMTQMADALNSAIKQVGEFAQQKSSIEAWKQIFSDNATAAQTLTGAIKPILQIFTDVSSVGAPLLKELAQHFKDAADRAAEFVSKAKESGQLKQWIQEGLQAVKDLWDAFKNVVAIIKDLATTQGFGPNFLQALKDVTGAIRWLIENIPGATAAVQLFFDAWVFAKIVQGLANMVSTISNVIDMLKKLVTANEEAAVAGEASAARFSNAWKTAAAAIGIGALAVGADALLPKNTPQEEQQAQQHPLTSGYGAANRDELAGIASAIKDPMKALDDLKQELNAFPAQFASSPFMNFFRILPVTIQTALSGIGGVFQTMWTTIQTGANSFAQGFMAPINSAVNGVKTAWGGLTGFFSGLWQGIVGTTQTAWQGLVGFFQGLWQGIVGTAQSAWNGLVGFLRGIPGQIQTMWNGLTGFFSGLWQGIVTVAQTAWNGLVTFIKGIPGDIQTAWNGITSFFQGLWQGIATTAQSTWQSIVQTVTPIPGQIVQLFQQLPGQMAQIGTAIVQGIGQAIQSGWSWLTNLVQQLAQQLFQAAKSALGIASPSQLFRDEVGKQITAGISVGIQSGSPEVHGALGDLFEWIQRLVGGFHGGHGGGGSGSGVGGLVSTGNTIGTSMLQRLTSSMAFGGAGGIASYARTVTAPVTQIIPPPAPTVPSPPGGGGHHHGHGGGYDDSPRPMYVESNSALVQEVLRLIRSEVRKQGGDVQLVLGT
jgi:phage-related protein